MKNLGDFLPGDVVDFKFNTHGADGAPITLAGTPSLACYKDNGTTEDTDGITLTVDFDSKTGLHHVRITTSSDLTFYSIGAQIQVAIAAGTVDGTSVVGTIVAAFSVARSLDGAGVSGVGLLSGTHTTTTADLGTNAPSTDISGQTIYWPAHKIARAISSYNTSTGVATFEAVAVTLADGNRWVLFPTAPDTGSLSAADVWAAGTRTLTALDEDSTTLDLDATIRAAMGLASANADTQIGNIYSRIGAPVGASISADIAAAKAALTDVQGRLPAALVSGRMDSHIGNMANNVLTAAAIAADAITAAKVAADAITEMQSGLATASALAAGVVKIDSILADTGTDGVVVASASLAAILDLIIEGTITLKQSLRLTNALAAGESSGHDGGAPVFRNPGDTRDRIAASVDEYGNRSVVTLDLAD